jgi:serine/threonine-protein kinase HipA
MEAENSNRAAVYYNEIKAGILTRVGDAYVFEYDVEYLNDASARPISLTMPLAEKKFASGKLFPFFDNLLPEGFLLEVTVAKLKIDKNDRFRLLMNVGGDTSGAVAVRPF